VIAPVGVTASGRYAQEDISNLDQRYRELNAGVQVTLPVTQDLALVGDVGYQDVQVSARDAVYDVNGVPVIGSNGRFVTDKSKPRAIAYDFSGLSWDAGVMGGPAGAHRFRPSSAAGMTARPITAASAMRPTRAARWVSRSMTAFRASARRSAMRCATCRPTSRSA
jgi:hypothetical protein